MKGKQRKGAALGMVVITAIVISMLVTIVFFIIDTDTVQTTRVYKSLQAKYTAISGAQLAMGAYFGEEGAATVTPVYDQFASRANGAITDPTDNPIKIESTHHFSNGTAEITMVGGFEDGNAPENYFITVTSKSEIEDGSGHYYVHEVKFNQVTSGIRSEQSYID